MQLITIDINDLKELLKALHTTSDALQDWHSESNYGDCLKAIDNLTLIEKLGARYNISTED